MCCHFCSHAVQMDTDSSNLFSSFLMWQPVAIHTQTKLVGVGLAYKLETSMVHTMYRCWHSNMDAMSSEDLIHAQRMVFHHSLSFITSMALKCAVDLGIPEAIHLHGGSATIADIVAASDSMNLGCLMSRGLWMSSLSPAFLLIYICFISAIQEHETPISFNSDAATSTELFTQCLI